MANLLTDKHRPGIALWLSIALVYLVRCALPAQAGEYQVLHNFCSTTHTPFLCADGAEPQGPLVVDDAGDIIGVTATGGMPTGKTDFRCTNAAAGCGTVFMLRRPPIAGAAWSERIVYNFCSQAECNDGAYPVGIVRRSDGVLFGETSQGGATFWQAGTVFALTPSGIRPESLETFSLNTLFANNDLSLGFGVGFTSVDAAGDVFVATGGGGNGERGSVMEFPGGAGGQTIYGSFCSVSTPTRNCLDGSAPNGPVLPLKGGTLFGTTSYNSGTIFALTPPTPPGSPGWTLSTIFSACSNGTDGCTNNPALFGDVIGGGLTADADGNLYGVTFHNGQGETRHPCYLGWCGGAVLKFSQDARTHQWTVALVYAFCQQVGCTDGSNPTGPLAIDAAGNLYGTTLAGGVNNPGCHPGDEFVGTGCGTLFRLSPPAPGGRGKAWSHTVLHNFCARFPTTCADGANPTAPLALAGDGALYGIARGGTKGHGIVFRYQF